ncbi:hypothetical protein [Janthinobacterium sp. CAN_S7]|uniref:hypothetical protein n=1 Tax=Janthinobacterium sp. CAN_S7 TaxID=3071704 RepID=UPI00319E794B
MAAIPALNTYAALPANNALVALKRFNPGLYALQQTYASNYKQLSEYADMQGFRDPIENLATVVHELIHIDSASHQGYLIEGTHYAPYLTPAAWPTLNNSTLTAAITPTDITALGPIYRQYILNAPNNTIANELDEINAYTQTIPFICANAPHQTAQHLRALTGHIALVDIYLRTLARSFTNQYHQLTRNQTSRGALETIIANGYTALNTCYRAGILEADPRPIPKSSTQAFAATK